MTARILISSCLIGAPVRYDCRAKTLTHPLIRDWQRRGMLVPLCPEGVGGLPTPRPPTEIEPGATAQAVLNDEARILTAAGEDLSTAFRLGAQRTLHAAQAAGCQFALLTDGSPSCGVHHVYDGHHSGTRQPGQGITAWLLAHHGIEVFAAEEIERLAAALPA